MASTTPNLRLVLEDSLTDTGRSNLLKIDSLGSIFITNITQDSILRSRRDIYLVPNDPSIGGSGEGGRIVLGTEEQPLDSISINAGTIDVTNFALVDTENEGKLTLKYAVTGNVNSALTFEVDPPEVTFSLSGDFSVQRATSLTFQGPDVNANILLNVPVSGTLATLDGTELLSNKKLDVLRIANPLDPNSWQGFQFNPSFTGTELSWTLPATAGQEGESIVQGPNGELFWQPILPATYEIDWDGPDEDFIAIHNLQSENVSVIIYNELNEQIWPNTISVVDNNTVEVSVTHKPNQTWRVIVTA